MLLATATPVQLRPVEAWDLLDILSRGSEAVPRGAWSNWRHAEKALGLIMADAPAPTDDLDMWGWIRTPLPPRKSIATSRSYDGPRLWPDEQVSANGSDWDRLRPADKARVKQMFPRFHQPAQSIHPATSSGAAANTLRNPRTRPRVNPI